MEALGQSTFEANACKPLLSNRTHVVAKMPTIKQTLIVNLPICTVDADAVAPWEKVRRPFPETVLPETEFELSSVLTKSTLILWDGDSPYKVFSGPGEKIDADWAKDTLPQRYDLLQGCPRIIAEHVIKFLMPTSASSEWSNIKTIFETVGHSSIQPAPITNHWCEMREEGIIPATVGYEVFGVVMAGLQNPAISRVTQASMTVPSSVFQDSPHKNQLLRLLAFISRIDREIMLPGYDQKEGDTKADRSKMIHRRPLNLLNQFAKWTKGQGTGSALKTRFPLSEQYLGLCIDIFYDAVQWITDNPDADSKDVYLKFKTLKERALHFAMGIWNQTIGTLPMTSIKYVQAIGHANAKVQFINRKLQEEINGNS